LPEIDVYHYVIIGKRADELLSRRLPATLKAIEQIGGHPILETRRAVDSLELDENGFLVPRADES